MGQGLESAWWDRDPMAKDTGDNMVGIGDRNSVARHKTVIVIGWSGGRSRVGEDRDRGGRDRRDMSPTYLGSPRD